MLDESLHHGLALSDVCSAGIAFKPPKRVSVSKGAAKNLKIVQPGGYVGQWALDETPYMAEPMDELASRVKEAVCFVGPARTGKTMGLLDGWLSHIVPNDPGDMLILQMSQEKAREYSKVRIDRAIRHSDALREMMPASSQSDNTFDKMFKHGMWLRIGWPTVTQLSGSDYRYVGETDYDRMPDDIDGEGSPFALGLKRTTTFMSRGMCMVESSPGRPLKDPNWVATHDHEAPPVGGILGIYNQGDQRRHYWRCEHCHDFFMASPGLGLFGLPSDDVLMELCTKVDIDAFAEEHNRIICPHCGCLIGPKAKQTMNMGGIWVPRGMRADHNRVLHGKALESTIASFWMGGVAAAYQSWRSLISRYMRGLRDYVNSGEETVLQATVNTDQGMPYMAMALKASKAGTNPGERKDAALQRFIVPDETRYLDATVDVQGGSNARFEVQVHANGKHAERWIVDRYSITESMRKDEDGNFAQIDPATYPEDWDVITERVLRSTYRTSIEGKEMLLRTVAVDTGGEHKGKNEGVTDKAYAWYRRLRKVNMHHRVRLTKGASLTASTTRNTPTVRLTMVGQRSAKEKGDIPLYMLNTNKLKDTVWNGMKRAQPGPGYVHIPEWFSKSATDELLAEVRNADGTWTKVRKRNESLDLLAMSQAQYLIVGADKIRDWDNAPDWAKPLAENRDLIDAVDRRLMQANEPVAQVAEDRRPPPRVARRGRRTSHSGYMG